VAPEERRRPELQVEQAVIAEVEAVDGRVFTEPRAELPGDRPGRPNKLANRVVRVCLEGTFPPIPLPLRRSAKPSFNAAVLRHLGRLRYLERLSIVTSRMSGKDLAQIASCDALRCLSVRNVAISAEDVRPLERLPHLEELDIENCNLRGEDLALFAAFPHLRRLNVTSWELRNPPAGLVVLRQRRPDLDVTLGAFSLGTSDDPDY
jgi:hypothetical protein